MMSGFKSLVIAVLTATLTTSCGLMDSLDTTNQNTTEMNEDMDQMVDGVDNMGLRTEEMNDAMGDMISTMEEMNKTMDEMNKTMDEMNKTHREMNKTMDQMSENMEDMKEDITELGTDARQGVSLGIRTQAWDRLNDAPDIDGKLAAASAYHMSFEYQTWKGSDLDTLERRKTLFFDGLSEYYRSIYGLADRHNWSLNVISKNNEMNVLYALAGTLEKINSNQVLFLKDSEELVSFLALFKKAVKNYKQMNDPDYDISTLPDYLEEASEFKQLTIYMLNLRHNILSGLVVSKLARMDRSTNRLAEFARQGRTVLSWRPKLDEYSRNAGLLKRLNYYISEANTLRDFLCENTEKGSPRDTDTVRLKMDGLLKRSINNMNIDQKVIDTVMKNQKAQPELAKEFIKSLLELKASVNKKCG